MNTQLKECTPITFHQDNSDLEYTQHIKMMMEMGLHKQVNMDPTVKKWRLERARNQFTELSTYELYLFKSIFPNTEKNIAKYDMEKIPKQVIKNLYNQHQMKIFERTELWLPAVKRTDPMLVGIIEPYGFILGLWGEPKIDIEEMEKNLLGNMYDLKDRVKNIINKTTVLSLKNKLEIYNPEHDTSSWHCRDHNLNPKRAYFIESFHDNRTIKKYCLAYCPGCQKIVNLAPTEME